MNGQPEGLAPNGKSSFLSLVNGENAVNEKLSRSQEEHVPPHLIRSVRLVDFVHIRSPLVRSFVRTFASQDSLLFPVGRLVTALQGLSETRELHGVMDGEMSEEKSATFPASRRCSRQELLTTSQLSSLAL